MRCIWIARYVLWSRVCPSVLHMTPVLYRNDWTDRACYQHRSFSWLMPHCIVWKIRLSTKCGYFCLEPCPIDSEHSRFLCRFLHFRHSTSTITSAVNLVQPSQGYHTERPPLLTTRWPWRITFRRPSATAEPLVLIRASVRDRFVSLCVYSGWPIASYSASVGFVAGHVAIIIAYCVEPARKEESFKQQTLHISKQRILSDRYSITAGVNSG